MSEVKFRFDRQAHEYMALDTGEVLPHITGMLDKAGLVDDTWFTEESSDRGTCVHKMTADYDLGAMDVESCVSIYRGYLLAHVKAMHILRPTILAVEEALVHPGYRFGGRIDRVVQLYGIRGVLEIKSLGAKSALPLRSPLSHRVQTYLQVMLDSVQCGIPPEHLGRWCLYIKPNGAFRILDHNRDHADKSEDIRKAREAIRISCGEGVAA